MPQVRCPRCGAANDTRAPGYPFCASCEENLARCGYCQWFDGSAVICTHSLVAGIFEVSEEATPPCGYHTPKQSLRVPRWGVRVLVWAGLAAAAFALGYGLLGLFQEPARKPMVPGVLELAVEADYRGAVVGEHYTVMALIYNPSDVGVKDVRLEIAADCLSAFYLEEVRPQPLDQTDSARWRVLFYPQLHPKERRRIALEMVPREAGPQHLLVRVMSGGNVYHGQCDLPIVVAEKGDGERGDREIGEEEVR